MKLITKKQPNKTINVNIEDKTQGLRFEGTLLCTTPNTPLTLTGVAMGSGKGSAAFIGGILGGILGNEITN